MTQTHDQPEEAARGGVEERLARHGKMSYVEIPVSDVRQSATFYERAFGWHVEVREDGSGRFDAPGDVIGHWITDRPASAEPGIVPYLYVDGIHATVERIAANGGEVVRAPYTEENLVIATVRDPAGNLLGIWERAEP